VPRSLRGREAIAAVLSDVWRYTVSPHQVDRLSTRDRNPLPCWNPTGGVVVADEDEVRAWARPLGPRQLPISREPLDARRKR
jgi:hypothetical protein